MIVDIDKKNLLFIFFITLLLLSFKWAISYLNFPNEDINLRVLYEIADSSYFPLIKSFINLDFNPSYLLNDNSLQLISFPALSLLINVIFIKIFGSYGFLVIEFLSVFTFLAIFYYIFRSINISNQLSLLFSLAIFTLPFLIDQLTFLNSAFIEKINLNFHTFYSLRNPRPLISNLYLFISIYYLIKFFYLDDKRLSNYIILGIIIGLTLHTFFYFFIFQIILIIFLYIKFYKLNFIKFIFLNLKFNLIFFLIILSFAILFILQINFSEVDYRERMGMNFMDFDKKKIMFNYLVNFFLNKEFIFLFLANSILFFFSKKNTNDIFYYLFLSTILSTTIFIAFSKSSIDYYHFFNWILVSGTLYVITSFFVFTDKYLSILLSHNKKYFFSIVFAILMILFFNFSMIESKFFYKDNSISRNNLYKLTSFIKSDEILSIKKLNILTLNQDIFKWLVLNDYKNFSIVPNSFWTPKKTSRIENELISVFKLLNLSEKDFLVFFKNSRRGYRFINENTRAFFDRLYLANKLIIFNDISNFTLEHQSFIKKTNPLYSHQSIIPLDEFNRFEKKFINYENKIFPEIIILDNKDEIINKHNLDREKYCLRYVGNKFKIYVSNKILDFCILIKN